MDFAKPKVKFVDWFKDGNILGGREFRPGEVVVMEQQDLDHILTSGGLVEVVDRVIPNPRKQPVVETDEPVEEGKDEKVASPKPSATGKVRGK